jgi:hypothetical protein
MKEKLIVWVGVIASVIGIVVFITGKQNLHEVVDPPRAPKPYEVGLPPAPPDIQSDQPVPVIEADDNGKPLDSSCSLYERKIAIVIKANQHTARNQEMPSYELSGEDGGRYTYYLDEVGNIEAGWLDVIMIPGRRIRINGSVCGSAGILTLTRVEMLSAAER